MGYSTVSQIARRAGVAPRFISDLFYQRILDDKRCPIMAGRRMIPDEYQAEVIRIVLERSKPGVRRLARV